MDKSKKLTIIALACIVLSVAVAAVASAQWEDYYGDDYVDPGLFWGLTGALCFIPLVLLIIGILLAVWVYKDAQKRGSSGALWLIIVILTGIIGLIIWLVVRPPIGGEKKTATSSERKCPNCGRVIPDDARTCPYCAKNFEG